MTTFFAPARPAPRERLARMTARLTELLFGTDESMHTTTKLAFLGATQYLLWALVIGMAGVPLGLLTPLAAKLLVAQDVVAALVFYPLVRSGVTKGSQDPGLTLPQVLWNAVVLVACYATVVPLRPVLLQTLCLIQVFCFVGLRPWPARGVGLTMIGMLLVMLAAMTASKAPGFDPRDEGLKVAAACFVLALLTWQAGRFADMRQQVDQEQRRLREATETVRHLALHDDLTGLPNRQNLQERIEAERVRATRTGSIFSVVMIDLDHFKKVNDVHGHHVGDEVLAGFARAARGALRDTDVLGRWGGEEFVILQLDTADAPRGMMGLQRLRQVLPTTCLSAQQPQVRVTFSAGVATWRLGETLDAVMARADQALYAAKAQGRDRIVVAS